MISLQYIFITLICLQHPSSLISQQTAATRYFLEKTQTPVRLFSLQAARNGKLITSNLEEFRNLYASLRNFLANQYYRNYRINYKYIVDAGKVQQEVNPAVPFPCDLNNTRSSNPPNSVHELRPGDIDIIGVLGDSLTAGSAMMSRIYTQLLIEFRGQTALGGGLKDWRTILTLPNILKVFNPNLYGYSIANTLGKSRDARFNPAEPFATTQDLPYMAEVLIKRIQTNPNVNMAKHWKMISIFIGANDICNDMCYYDNTKDFLAHHRRDLHKTLTILRDNIPRLLVNIVVLPDIDNIIQSMKNIPAQCGIFHATECHCLIGNSINSKQLEERHNIIRQFQQIDLEVAALPEFQLDEFAVVPRTIAVNKTLPLLPNGNTDLRYFAIDCFHFSQYGNAAFSNMLWNDLLQVKTKQSKYFSRPFETFACPSKEKPFIRTLKNS